MTTTYYTFHTRKVKVSGGADLLSLVPVAQAEATAVSADGKILAPKDFGGKLPSAMPETEDKSETKAEILDFALCRKHMETRNAWNTLTRAAQEEDEEELLDERWEAVVQTLNQGLPICYRKMETSKNLDAMYCWKDFQRGIIVRTLYVSKLMAI